MKLSQIPTVDLATFEVVALGALVYIMDDETESPILCQHAVIVEKNKVTQQFGQTVCEKIDSIKCIVVVPTTHDKASGVIPIFKMTNNKSDGTSGHKLIR